MTVTLLGWVSLAVVAAFLVCGRSLVPVLALSVPFPDSAAVVVGGTGIAPYFLVSILALGQRFVWGRLATARRLTPLDRRAVRPLVLLILYGAAITCLGPWLFQGAAVFSADHGLDEQVLSPATLTFSASNAGQLIYLLLNLGVVLLAATDLEQLRAWTRRLLLLGLSVAVVVEYGSLDALREVFDTLPDGFYASPLDARARGQFSEPSHLGAFSAAACAWFLFDRDARWWIRLGGLGLATGCLVESRAGTAAVALGALLLWVAGRAAWTASRTLYLPVAQLLLGLAVTVGLVLLQQDVIEMVASNIEEKRDSGSASTRFVADRHAVRLLVESWGLGSGLGANRASGLFAMLLSTVGLIGTYLFYRFHLGALTGASSPAVRACLAVTVVATSATYASLSLPLLWFSAGVALWQVSDWRQSVPTSAESPASGSECQTPTPEEQTSPTTMSYGEGRNSTP